MLQGSAGERAELEAKGLTAAEQRLLVDAFLKPWHPMGELVAGRYALIIARGL